MSDTGGAEATGGQRAVHVWSCDRDGDGDGVGGLDGAAGAFLREREEEGPALGSQQKLVAGRGELGIFRLASSLP